MINYSDKRNAALRELMKSKLKAEKIQTALSIYLVLSLNE